MNPIAIELRQMADRLRELFPESGHISLDIINDGDEQTQAISFQRCGDCAEASALLSRIGIEPGAERKHDEPAPFTVMEGRNRNSDVTFKAYGNGHPFGCVKCGQPEAVL